MDRERLLALTAAGVDEMENLSRQLGKPIDIDRSAIVMLARMAIPQPDSEAYIRKRVGLLVEEMVRRYPDRPAYKYEYEPPDANERRQAGTFYAGMSTE